MNVSAAMVLLQIVVSCAMKPEDISTVPSLWTVYTYTYMYMQYTTAIITIHVYFSTECSGFLVYDVSAASSKWDEESIYQYIEPL